MVEDKEFLKAKNSAYRLLSYRQRSVKEIRERLKKKGFAAANIRKTIQYLREIDYLNDESFARAWIQTKIDSHPLGWSLLRYQLKQKGVAEEIIEKLIAELAPRYNEYEAARQLAERRRSRYRNLEPLKLKKRLYDYLRRRGFSQEAILQAIK